MTLTALDLDGLTAAAADAKVGSEDYWKIRDAVYARVYAKLRQHYETSPVHEKIRELRDRQLTEGLALLDRMITPAA
jgi:hypothetical protein